MQSHTPPEAHHLHLHSLDTSPSHSSHQATPSCSLLPANIRTQGSIETHFLSNPLHYTSEEILEACNRHQAPALISSSWVSMASHFPTEALPCWNFSACTCIPWWTSNAFLAQGSFQTLWAFLVVGLVWIGVWGPFLRCTWLGCWARFWGRNSTLISLSVFDRSCARVWCCGKSQLRQINHQPSTGNEPCSIPSSPLEAPPKSPAVPTSSSAERSQSRLLAVRRKSYPDPQLLLRHISEPDCKLDPLVSASCSFLLQTSHPK